MKKLLLGKCLVDSGQIILIDPCYVRDGIDYQAVMETTIDKKTGRVKVGGEVAGGVATCTLYGDGEYPVYGYFKKGNNSPSRIEIIFE